MTRLLPLFLAISASFNSHAAGPDYIAGRLPSLQPDRVVVYKKVADRELELRVFLPDGWKPTDRRPCLHLIHGGGWGGMDPSRMYPFAADFAKRHGMVGISVQYRLYKPGATTVFDCVKDARSSLRYVRAHAAELGIDPAKIVVSGGSAGGHLAASTALFDTVNEETDDLAVSCRPDAMILLFPVIDTSAEGYGQAKIGERWRELSPVHHVRAGLPPTLTFHGTGDTVTPFAGAKGFHEAMLAAGNKSVLDVNEGGKHGYLMFEESLYEDTLTKAAAFLTRHGFLPVPNSPQP
jgi:acetyl esterase/lipase